MFFVYSPLVSWLVFGLCLLHFFVILICFGRFYLVLLNQINKTESDTFNIKWVRVLKSSYISQVFKKRIKQCNHWHLSVSHHVSIADFEHEDVNPTTDAAAVCLKRVVFAEAQFYVPRSQRRSSGAIKNSSKHLNMNSFLNAEIVVVILFFVVFLCVFRIHINCFYTM